MANANLILFLIELSELSNKYNMYIGGCGCCGSPYITGDGGDIADDLSFDFDTQTYEVEEK